MVRGLRGAHNPLELQAAIHHLAFSAAHTASTLGMVIMFTTLGSLVLSSLEQDSFSSRLGLWTYEWQLPMG